MSGLIALTDLRHYNIAACFGACRLSYVEADVSWISTAPGLIQGGADQAAIAPSPKPDRKKGRFQRVCAPRRPLRYLE